MSLIRNKKAHLNYTISDTVEAGIVLSGGEVKSVRAGHGNIDSAFVVIEDGELFLIGASIPPYQIKNTSAGYDDKQTRKLLLHKTQIRKLVHERDAKKLTLFPVSLYNKGRQIKVEVALGKGKKLFDKREDLKERAIDRDIRREIKDR